MRRHLAVCLVVTLVLTVTAAQASAAMADRQDGPDHLRTTSPLRKCSTPVARRDNRQLDRWCTVVDEAVRDVDLAGRSLVLSLATSEIVGSRFEETFIPVTPQRAGLIGVLLLRDLGDEHPLHVYRVYAAPIRAGLNVTLLGGSAPISIYVAHTTLPVQGSVTAATAGCEVVCTVLLFFALTPTGLIDWTVPGISAAVCYYPCSVSTGGSGSASPPPCSSSPCQ